MSSNYAVLGIGMGVAGVLTDLVGARAVWIGAGCVYLFAALVAVVMTRWLPVAQEEEWEAVESSSESAAAALRNGHEQPVDGPEPTPEPANGSPTPPIERIATLLEEIESRRASEAQRPS
jgi:hypothetical protein